MTVFSSSNFPRQKQYSGIFSVYRLTVIQGLCEDEIDYQTEGVEGS